jgi:hypothetical protein
VMRLAWPAAVTLLTLSLAGVLLELMPGVRQMNGPLVALLLPVHAGAVLALWQAIPRTSSTPEDSEYGLRLSQAA